MARTFLVALLVLAAACTSDDRRGRGIDALVGEGGAGAAGGDGGGGSGGSADGEGNCPGCTDDCAERDPACWCPNPACEREGCIDGVAWNCDFYGDCADQLPGNDCAAAGLTCWESADPQETGGAQFYCASAGCGDGVVQEGEACDDGPENGGHLAACTPACQPPPVAVLDQRHAASSGEPGMLSIHPTAYAAFQTFTAEKSGRLAWIAADLSQSGLYVLRDDGYDFLASAVATDREVGATRRREHHFLDPVFLEAGRQYAFGLWCGGGDCELEVTHDDRYPAGELLFRPHPGSPAPAEPAPAGVDLPFETWIIEEDEGCGGPDPIACISACDGSGPSGWAICIAGQWGCPAGYLDASACIPRHEGALELVREIAAGELPVTQLPIDTGTFEPWLVLRPETDLEVARLILPGTRFEATPSVPPMVRILRGAPQDRPADFRQAASGHRAGSEETWRFDFVPPIVLQAGETWSLALDRSAELPVHADPAIDWASVELVPWRGKTAPEVPDGAVIPLQIWRLAQP